MVTKARENQNKFKNNMDYKKLTKISDALESGHKGCYDYYAAVKQHVLNYLNEHYPDRDFSSFADDSYDFDDIIEFLAGEMIEDHV